MQKIETNLSETVEVVTDVGAAYDTNVKYLLADKQILARILKYAVQEFKDMSLEEIMGCIGDDIEIGTRQVDAGLSNLGRVSASATEDNIPGEGKIFYDIRFSAYHKKEEMKFLINVEAQKTSSAKTLGYHLENRIIFYLARMISAQKQTEFFHSDYDSLKKVRSIWICMDSGENNDSIEELVIDRKKVFGNVPETDVYDVDLLRGIIIRIRNRENVTESKNVLISMLENLLSSTNTTEKRKILSEKYGLIMTTEMEGRINTMCNLSENIAEKALERGRGQGGIKKIASFLSKGGSEKDAIYMLDATEEEIEEAKKLIANK